MDKNPLDEAYTWLEQRAVNPELSFTAGNLHGVGFVLDTRKIIYSMDFVHIPSSTSQLYVLSPSSSNLSPHSPFPLH